MKPESAAHIVLSLPELFTQVFVYLSPHDLSQCIHVCKNWAYHAEPILWQNFSPGKYYWSRFPPLPMNWRKYLSTVRPLELTLQERAVLRKHLSYIRTIELTLQDCVVLRELAHGVPHSLQTDDSAIIPSTCCTHLKQLRLNDS